MLCFNIKFKTSKSCGTFGFLKKLILSILILVSIDVGLKFIKFLSLIFAVLNLYDRELFLSLYISFIELRDILEVLFNLEVFAENLLFFLIKFPN